MNLTENKELAEQASLMREIKFLEGCVVLKAEVLLPVNKQHLLDLRLQEAKKKLQTYGRSN